MIFLGDNKIRVPRIMLFLGLIIVVVVLGAHFAVNNQNVLIDVIAIAFATVVVLANPFIGLLAFLLRSEMNLDSMLGWIPGISAQIPLMGYVLIGLTFISLFLKRLTAVRQRYSTYIWNKTDYGILAWTFFTGVSWALAEARGANIVRLEQSFLAVLGALLSGVLYFTIRVLVKRPIQIKLIIAVMVAGALVQCLDAVLQGILGQGIYPVEYKHLSEIADQQRIAGLVGDPNYLAASLLVPMALVAFSLLRPITRKPYESVFLWLSFTLITISLVLTYSRGAWLGAVIVLCVIVIKAPRKLPVFMFGIILVTLVFVIGENSFSTRLMTASDDFATRVETTQRALSIWSDYFLIGVGPGNYIMQSLKYGALPGAVAGHNTYAELLATLGIFGGGAAILTLVSALISYHKSAQLYALQTQNEFQWIADGMTVGLLGWLVSIAFLSVSLDYGIMPYLALAGVLSSFAKPTVNLSAIA